MEKKSQPFVFFIFLTLVSVSNFLCFFCFKNVPISCVDTTLYLPFEYTKKVSQWTRQCIILLFYLNERLEDPILQYILFEHTFCSILKAFEDFVLFKTKIKGGPAIRLGCSLKLYHQLQKSTIHRLHPKARNSQ